MLPLSTWTPAGDPGQALGSSLGLELELDLFYLTFDWQKLEKSVRCQIRDFHLDHLQVSHVALDTCNTGYNHCHTPKT